MADNTNNEKVVDLSALKRKIEDVEIVNGSVDNTQQHILLRINAIESVINEIKSAHNTVVNQNADEFNNLIQELENQLNEVYAEIDTKINASIAAKEVEVQDIINKLGTLKKELANIDVSILETIDEIADTVNELPRQKFYKVTINSVTGRAKVDITDLGLNSAEDYVVNASVENDWTVQPVILNKQATSFEIGLVDRRYFADFEVYKDCSKNPVTVGVQVAYNNNKYYGKVVSAKVDSEGEDVVVGDETAANSADNTTSDSSTTDSNS
jgi:hypothetical protein